MILRDTPLINSSVAFSVTHVELLNNDCLLTRVTAMTATDPKEDKNPILDEEDDELKCGYSSWTPSWLQRFNKPPWLLVTVMIATFTQGKLLRRSFSKVLQLY